MKQNKTLFTILAIIVCIMSIFVIGYAAIVSHAVEDGAQQNTAVTTEEVVASEERVY